MDNKISYTFWQQVNHAVVIGGGLTLVTKSISVLAGCGTSLTPLWAVFYGGLFLRYVTGIPYYVYKTYYKK